MVDKIPPLGHALTALQRTTGSARPDGAIRSGDSSAERRLKGAEAGIEERIRNRIAQISPEDPQRRRRALRVIIEVSLLKEFGSQLEADPAFHSLVDQVAQTMGESPELQSTVDVALEGLLP
jgi:hypothetical protein